mgnify:CR=1 FL=1
MRIVFLLTAVLLTAACGEERASVQAQLSKVDISLQSTGELASSDTISISPPMVKHTWQHKITFMIPEGTWVKKGQRILAFDSQQQMERIRETQNKLATEKQKLQSQKLDNEEALEKLKLSVAEAEMNLLKAREKAKQDGDYASQLEVKKLVIDLKIANKALALKEYEEKNKLALAEVERDMTLSEVQRLQAELKEQQMALASMTVKAPKDGIVVYLQDHDGSKPAQGDSVFFARKLLELPNLATMIVKTTIPEQEISRVAIGQTVEIKLDAIPDKTFSGKVQSLGQIVRVKSREEPSMVYDAVLSIDAPDTELMRPGMAARLNIIEKQLTDVIALPEGSLHSQDERQYVEVKSLLGVKRAEVSVIGRQDGQVLIKGDIQPGDEVLL